MSDASTPATPPAPSLQRLGAAALGLLHGHVELFGIELQEQKERSLQALVGCCHGDERPDCPILDDLATK